MMLRRVLLTMCVCMTIIGGSVGFEDFVYQCLCGDKGPTSICDCGCSVPTVHAVNEGALRPLLAELVTSTFFRYYKINLNRECPFWEDNGMCFQQTCSVRECSPSEVPVCWQEEDQALEEAGGCDPNSEAALSAVQDDPNSSFFGFPSPGEDHDSYRAAMVPEYIPEGMWTAEDLVLGDADATYVDLLLNPERFTGYKGFGAWRVWRAVYEENCFAEDRAETGLLSEAVGDAEAAADAEMCFEKRVFHRLISGLHTSITMHIVGDYYHEDTDSWGPNYPMFRDRLQSHPEYIENLYFTYMLALRALEKAMPLLREYPFAVSNATEEAHVRDLVAQIETRVVDQLEAQCPVTFDETQMFTGPDAQQLKRQFALRFFNISRIMDCVECSKCRMWGKIQILGLGTALKILFADDDSYVPRRNEISALFWVINRLSESVATISTMRQLEVQHVIASYTRVVVWIIVGVAAAMALYVAGRWCTRPARASPSPKKQHAE